MGLQKRTGWTDYSAIVFDMDVSAVSGFLPTRHRLVPQR